MWLVWLALGLPGFVLAQGFRGEFSLLPDLPPDGEAAGIFVWATVVALVYLPVVLVPAGVFLVARERRRNSGSKGHDAQD